MTEGIRELAAEKARLKARLRASVAETREARKERLEIRRNLSHVERRLRSQVLSEREMDVLEGIAGGATNKEIAERLFLAEETVKTHVRSVLAKLRARNRTHAVLLAVRLGLIR